MVYDIYYESQSVGTAQVDREGLYYRLECRCKPVQRPMVRLCVSCGEKVFDLGIMIPEKGLLTLKTRIPVKHLGNGTLQFSLNTGREEEKRFVAVYPEEPFSYLHRLNNAYLEKRNGQVGVVLQKESDKPTGQ